MPKDAARARTLHTQACTGGVAAGCIAVGNGQAACTLGDQGARNTLCAKGATTACSGASPEVQAMQQSIHEKIEAEGKIPGLLTKCSTDRTTILHWKDTLAAALKAGNEPKAMEAQQKLNELEEPWHHLKADLEQAIVVVTGARGPRYLSLQQQARQACTGHP